jgi:uncharacterized protein (DUF2062 family)
MERWTKDAFWSRRVLGPVLGLLRQGLSPEGIALSLAFGLAAAIFPVIGATTLLGLAIGAILRLNQPALQLANWLAYPLQLVLILPLVRLGEWVAGVPPMPFAVSHVVARVTADPVGAVTSFGMTGLHGILGWVTVLPFVVLGLYRLLLPALRAANRRVRPAGGTSAGEASAERIDPATPETT